MELFASIFGVMAGPVSQAFGFASSFVWSASGIVLGF